MKQPINIAAVKQYMFKILVPLFLLGVFLPRPSSCFQLPQPSHHRAAIAPKSIALLQQQNVLVATTTSTVLYSQPDEYSRDVRLREEAESPFRKIRFFFYASLGAGAFVSLLLSVLRIVAAASGINSELMNESLVNAGVDAAGLVVLGLAWQRDLQAQNSQLKRATKGASLAKLAIRVHKGLSDPLFSDDDDNTKNTVSNYDPNSFVSLTLADLRRNRGIGKRVVIAAAGRDKIATVVEEARAYGDALEASDLIIVPVVLPMATAPDISSDTYLPQCVALPIGQSAWKNMLDDETQEARKQGVDIEAEGICVILKKNGRVGQRTKGIFLERMVGEVEERREMGMDVTNI